MQQKCWHFLFLIFLINSIKGFAANLTNIEFIHNDEYGELLLHFDQPNISLNKYHNKEDKQIILDIQNTQSTPRVMRPFDTSEFAGGLVFVSPYINPSNPNDLRITLSLRENVRSILQQKDNVIVLTLENRYGIFDELRLKESEQQELKLSSGEKNIIHTPKSAELSDILDNLLLSGEKKYIGKKISFNVKDIRIDDLLKMIAETSGFNIILNEEVTKIPPLSLSLTNIPWDQALDTIFKLGKLVATKNGNILMVTTLSSAMALKIDEEKAKRVEKKKEPLVTKIYPVSFAKSEDVIKLLQDYITPKRGSISIDKRTNSLIIKDTMETIERMGKIIETLDTQTPLIQIEAKIVEASDDFRQNFGLTDGLGIGYDPVSNVTESKGPGMAFSSASNVMGDKTGTGALLQLSVSVYKRLKGLNFQLQLQESQSKVKILSSPKVVTENNTPAKLTSSESVPYQEVSMSAGVTINTWKQAQALLSLEVTPKVTNEGSISMGIDLSKGSFGAKPDNGAPPPISNRAVKTNILVDNGSTAVLGGIYDLRTTESHHGIPFLKDIPLIGWLFRSAYNPTRVKNELIIFITPRVINQEQAGLIKKESGEIQMQDDLDETPTEGVVEATPVKM